jgi:hypothetical protein
MPWGKTISALQPRFRQTGRFAEAIWVCLESLTGFPIMVFAFGVVRGLHHAAGTGGTVLMADTVYPQVANH